MPIKFLSLQIRYKGELHGFQTVGLPRDYQFLTDRFLKICAAENEMEKQYQKSGDGVGGGVFNPLTLHSRQSLWQWSFKGAIKKAYALNSQN